jgi:hypothetical protein
MKRNYVLAASLIIMIAASSCGGNEEHNGHKQDTTSHQAGKETASAATATTEAAKLKDGNVDAIYQHYIHLTNALIKEDAADARMAASAIEAGARELSKGQAISAAAHAIAATGDVEQQRSSYAKLSDLMIKDAKSSGLKSGELYVDYCPMAMNNKGAYWLSTKKEIVNPYFGEEMLNCGEIKETIK